MIPVPTREGLRLTAGPPTLAQGIARVSEGNGEMVDVMCPLSFDDLDALLADEQLPSELAAVFEDSARSVELPGGYEMELTEAEARALLTYAGSHEMRHLERNLRQELASLERRQRESGPTRSSG